MCGSLLADILWGPSGHRTLNAEHTPIDPVLSLSHGRKNLDGVWHTWIPLEASGDRRLHGAVCLEVGWEAGPRGQSLGLNLGVTRVFDLPQMLFWLWGWWLWTGRPRRTNIWGQRSRWCGYRSPSGWSSSALHPYRKQAEDQSGPWIVVCPFLLCGILPEALCLDFASRRIFIIGTAYLYLHLQQRHRSGTTRRLHPFHPVTHLAGCEEQSMGRRPGQSCDPDTPPPPPQNSNGS
ncbi:uncharacterized protein LOC115068847 [Nannospalax galili]|uniref:uncharacterized protein LOC115068847 n=1 Tax=Nannospalax galili TaxID=1026970 RepID=UPI00111BFAFE|nr:uncharacterized protein LOC115068847 [Nannospalax galili]